MTKAIPLEELRFRAIRDPKLLEPGTLVIMAHVPDLEKGGYGGTPSGEIVTIREVRNAEIDFGLGPEEHLKIHYFDKAGEHECFAGDRGVIRYPNGNFNDSNFIVLVSELVDAGLEISLDVSEEYKVQRRTMTYGDPVDDFYDDEYEYVSGDSDFL